MGGFKTLANLEEDFEGNSSHQDDSYYVKPTETF